MITILATEPHSLKELSRKRLMNAVMKVRELPQKDGKRHPRRKPKGGRLCLLEETPVGYLLKHEAPTEWSLLEHLRKSGQRVTAGVIERIGYSSVHPLFKSARFRMALADFRKHGRRTRNVRTLDVKNEISVIEKRILKGEPDFTV